MSKAPEGQKQPPSKGTKRRDLGKSSTHLLYHKKNMRCIPLRILLILTVFGAASAQQPSSSSKSKRNPEQHETRRSTTPAIAETLYRNPEFAFTYKIPYAWVDRTQQMQDDSTDPTKSKLLLAVFERPPEVAGDTVNSAVVITAESAATYPGLKTAADYLGPLTELTTSKGFKPAGDPYEFSVGSTPLVRADFFKEIGKLTMHQSSLVVLRKGFVVSVTFIAGSDDDLDELIEKLSFGAPKS
jgi:hypothetical protein